MTLTEIKDKLQERGIEATEDEILDRLKTAEGLTEDDIPAIQESDLPGILKLFSTSTIAPIPPKPAKKGGTLTRTKKKSIQQQKQVQPVQEIPIAVPFTATADQLAPFVEALTEKTNAIGQAASALAYVNSNFASLVIQQASQIEAETGRSTADFSEYLADCRSGMQLINDRMAQLGFAGWNESEDEDDAIGAA